MNITSLMTEKYVPKYRGNQDLPEADRIVATLEYLSVEEYDKIADDPSKIIARCVTKLENFSVNGLPVETGEALVAQLKRDVGDLAADLWKHITFGSLLDKAEEKNSESRSSSPSEGPRTKEKRETTTASPPTSSK